MLRNDLLRLVVAPALIFTCCCSGGPGTADSGEGGGDNGRAAVDVADGRAALESAGEDGGGELVRRAPTRLRAVGTKIVDGDGQEVVLRGVNLGGWLFTETWIPQIDYSFTSRLHLLGQREGIGEEVDSILVQGSPAWHSEGYLEGFLPKLAQLIGEEQAEAFGELAAGYLPGLYDDSDLPLRRKLTDRFGTAVRDELLDLFHEAWLGEADLAWLAGEGFNLVRVPMTYRTLTVGPDLDLPAELVWNEAAFARLDQLLEWCERYGIYAVLDIQEAPGAQNGYAGPALLYSEPAMEELAVVLWEELSDRYRDRDIVAAYSLLAEPFGAPDAAERDRVYDRLVQAIRARGDDHLLVIHDGFFGMESLPLPSAMGWEGVVYSTHLFEFSVTTLEAWELLVDFVHDPHFTKAQAAHQVPYFIGSFSTRAHADWSYQATRMLVEWYESRGWSWAIWSYKRIDDPIDQELWGKQSCYGLRGRLTGPLDRPDIFDDDLETLRNKLAAYADLELAPNEELLAALRQGLEASGN